MIPIVRDETLEKSLIASAIVDENALYDFAHRIRKEDFTNTKLGVIAGELVKCATKGYTPDVGMIASKLGDDYMLELGNILTVSTNANIKHMIHKIKEVTLAREIVNKAAKIMMSANNIQDHKDFSQTSMSLMHSIDADYGGGRLEHISNSFDKAMVTLQKLQNGEELGIKTGIAGLDAQTNGFRKKELIIIAGRPAQGKTSFALSILKNVSLMGKNIGMFSLEMGTEELIFKLASMMSSTGKRKEIPMRCFRGVEGFTKDHYSSMESILKELSQSNIYVNDSATSSMTDIEVEMRKFIRQKGLDIVVVDYIGLVNDDSGASKKRHEIIQEFSMRFKRLAKELDIPIVVLVQLSRDAQNKRPHMGNLAESGQIERDADMIYLLWQPTEEDTKRKILIGAKGRGVGTADLPMHFSNDTTEFVSMSKEEGESYFNEIAGSKTKPLEEEVGRF